MSARLRRRVAALGGSHQAAMAGYTPVGGGAASPAAVAVLPLAQVQVYPHPGAGYATIAYRGLAPIYTADGAAVPASSPGRWAQLAAAGRP
jgi:hypothetical protein